jgi:hypothetical protein
MLLAYRVRHLALLIDHFIVLPIYTFLIHQLQLDIPQTENVERARPCAAVGRGDAV